MVFEDETAYADSNARLANKRSYEWVHGVGEVVTALVQAGLAIDFVREHPFVAWEMLPGMVRGEDDLWRLPDDRPSIPLSFSLRAVRPAD